jgi:hypothetical protein
MGSGLILFHLVGVIAGPFAVPPSSPLAGWIFVNWRWYSEAMFLNHGYRFFAPEPGESYLVRYQVELPDGQVIQDEMPNLQTQWPRVLYHRHFMLTSRLQLGPDAPEVQALALSYAEHLYQRYTARRVTLELVRHNLPSVVQGQQGMKLTDPSLYEVFPLIDYYGPGKVVRPPPGTTRPTGRVEDLPPGPPQAREAAL